MTSFERVIRKYRDISFSERDKGSRFEKLMKAYLLTKPEYNGYFSDVWLWNEFPARKDFGGKDTGIDLVARTVNGDYWAVQCKCYDEHTAITKPMVDTFLSTSSKHFEDVYEAGKEVTFSMRLWIDTTVNNLNSEAENTLHNQNPPVKRINFTTLSEDPVDWEKLDEGISGKDAAVPKYGLRDHQKEAVDKAHGYLKDHDRGKLIMACGTGKTFTSLKIAENETDSSGLILFLVPSIALLGQSLNEWCAQADKPLHCLCICSDTKASETKNNSLDDSSGITTDDLPLPASTNIPNITKQYFRALEQQQKNGGMVVVFSTYQSIDVIMKVQRAINSERENSCNFDLIICDEAHRTTGITLKDEDESSFVKVHSNDNIQGKKRIYMTATPRLYTGDAQTKAKASEAVLCSMDDTALYGEEIYRIGFGEAVEKHLLSDYKVIVLTVGEEQMTDELQASIAGASEGEIKTDDALKLIGCINALSKITKGADKQLFTEVDPEKMHSAVAFCQNIKISKATTAAMNACREGYFTTLSDEEKENIIAVEAEHVDGTMNSNTRKEKLLWLKAAQRGSHDCHILMNVRCLSEGVDVPSLDAVLFLSAKNSQIDVVQSVGRVMRRAPDKKYGYIIIPVVIPSNVEPEKVLDDNDRFKVVWTVLNALRAHDDRFNATINKIQLNKKKPDNIAVVSTNIGGRGSDTDETGSGDSTGKQAAVKSAIEQQLELQFEKLQSVIYAKMVKKCGSRGYWEAWAAEVAVIAQHHIIQINALIHSNAEAKAEFDKYMEGLHKNINPSISEEDAVEMLAQHIITQPVFEALFNNYSFVKNNPVSQSLQGIVGCLNDKIPPEENEKLQKFYKSVQESCSGIDNAQSRQEIIVELYNNFFKTAFPKIVEKMGIVYTPVEIVDFIINSVEKVLNKEFGRSMTDENVHILDPFTGTGTFITRLLQSGIIKPEDLNRKYTKEIHANEIVLLAYYIASINIENVYHELEEQYGNKEAVYTGHAETELQVASSNASEDTGRFVHSITEAKSTEIQYVPFEGICLTDTFQMGENDESEALFSEIFSKNSDRVIEQKKAPIRIIMGNPPYSAKQESANDNAQNQHYPKLEERIATTYAAKGTATNKNALYDSYIKAFRWASDRIESQNGGIITFVSNGGWINAKGMDGLRKSFESEFDSIWVFNLRGNCRPSGEIRRKEAGNVFGSGSKTPIAVTILVRKENHKDINKAKIFYHDIGDYLSREEKLSIIKKSGNLTEIKWDILQPNEYGDWINQRNDKFGEFFALGDKDNKNNKQTFFVPYYSCGLKTQRDTWCYNFSKIKLNVNISTTINYYNEQLNLLQQKKIKDVIFNATKINWTRATINSINKLVSFKVSDGEQRIAFYRPYEKSNLFYYKNLNEMMYQIPKLFPTEDQKNIIICITGQASTKEFSGIITNTIPDVQLLANDQCFPLYWYEKVEAQNRSLFTQEEDAYIRHDAVTDFILAQAREKYGNKVTKEDIFYYVYGILHSKSYRQLFAADLKKMLPRLPLVSKPQMFWDFSKAGRALAKLHIEYETVEPYPDVTVTGTESKNFTVQQMKFPKKGQKDTILYNSCITVSNIPEKAYEYVVNGKSAIEWIMERYAVTTDKDSGITNDANDWGKEHGNERYILDLLLSVINVSVQTVDIVNGLPEVDWEKE